MQFFTKVQLENAKTIVKDTGISAVRLIIRKVFHIHKKLWGPLTLSNLFAAEVDIFR